ncbi:Pilus assembly protein [Aromatoleum aromaticum EbN1]|uniref:Pilus assembly protein n=1 Tax=Aromatoleum aromaticum (strain DSM 19018 / LMG 30748 / EbN1) TaxID=76114 RepID=Q5P0Y6_AROAE|nr:type IV pilin protein [Aromatoleum aromaticum]CAI09028.1 Pilus assembly protein [Aromatoleum aromaticum EbN1]
MKSRTGGFTLIELMIAVAVVAILAAIAVPSYMESIRKSRRSDATTSLAKIQLAQETYRLNNNSYGTLAALGLGATSTEGYYTIAITEGTISTTGYTATANAISGKSQASDSDCTAITMTVTGGGNTVSNTPATCWSK